MWYYQVLDYHETKRPKIHLCALVNTTHETSADIHLHVLRNWLQVLTKQLCKVCKRTQLKFVCGTQARWQKDPHILILEGGVGESPEYSKDRIRARGEKKMVIDRRQTLMLTVQFSFAEMIKQIPLCECTWPASRGPQSL